MDFVDPFEGNADGFIDEDDADELRAAAEAAALEVGWEPERPQAIEEYPEEPVIPNDGNEEDDHLSADEQLNTQLHPDRFYVTRYSDKYPGRQAGAATAGGLKSDEKYAQALGISNDGSNRWAPFASKLDWEVACWAKMRGLGSTAFSDLLSIDGVSDRLGLSYKNSQELNAIINKHIPPPCPSFVRQEVVVQGQSVEFYSRDILECLKSLWANPDFATQLIVEPERHYVDEDKTIRAYHDMHTGKWWWNKQVHEELRKPGSTIVPVIISSDQTQLTTFRNKNCYPVYVTIGNIPKEIRRKPSRQGQMLLGYLPIIKLSSLAGPLAMRRRIIANIFHACVGYMLKPLENAGRSGVYMTSGDGLVRRTHPLSALHVGDYPEQLLITGAKKGECPSCPIPMDEVGESAEIYDFRDFGQVLAAFEKLDQGLGSTAFRHACRDAGIKPIQQPYWRNLPFVNIFCSIAPDILHQLYQGVIKHLIEWLKIICTPEEIDARCRHIPPNHNIRVFMQGISHLSRVTGAEHDQICRLLLGLIIDIRLPDNLPSAPLIACTRALLDYLYITQYPVHTGETLAQLVDALDTFHDNKHIFIDLGVRTHFCIPKLHNIGHHRDFIELYGTMDNYNTEYTERLHIDLAKDAYRSTNHKDEYPQMTIWLERREKMQFHRKFLLCQETSNVIPPCEPPPSLFYPRIISMTKYPSVKGVPISSLVQNYGAIHFDDALRRFIAQYQQPNRHWTKAQLEKASIYVHLPFRKVSVYHRVKFTQKDRYSISTGQPESTVSIVDSIHVQPSRQDTQMRKVAGRFNTALIEVTDDADSSKPGVSGLHIGQVHCVFEIGETALQTLFDSRDVPRPPQHLSYVEWFTAFRHPEGYHGLYKVSRDIVNNERQASIVPVEFFRRSVHLIPRFGAHAPKDWTSSNVLEKAREFFVNTMSDKNMYAVLH
ncbi:hypothetical protein K435DRAFT_683009 [Dendrothele bispora CBS 962.96]|uniref:Uncharacterized protein n=1 Tax=Dendrothele bispora (strain CBS 962.96) TaxID=1314807 RepID=A0A4S8LCU6_DENBC|nr:hypothetical protein K435DRAFT_683009 [Dendrothele bispora CBS 962.96]